MSTTGSRTVMGGLISRRRMMVGTGALALASGVGAAAANELGRRPVTVVVPFPAGSGTDSVARIVQNFLSAELGTSIVIENKPGANAMIGSTAVSRATPDGHTLLLSGTTSHSIAPNLAAKPSYDPLTDFTPLTRIGIFPFVLVCNPSLPVKDARELIAYVKSKPGELQYAYGNGTGLVAGAALKAYAGMDVGAVPYRGTPTAVIDVIANRVQFLILDATTAIPHIRSGSIRALGVTTAIRSKLLPDVPPIADAGLPQYDILAWGGLEAPKGIPASIQAQLTTALTTVMAKPELESKLAEIGFELSPLEGSRYADFIQKDMSFWRKLLQDVNITAL